MNRQEFAQKIKENYPSYAKMDDNVLVDRIIQKNQLSSVIKNIYPQYTDIEDATIVKKVLPQISNPVPTAPAIQKQPEPPKEGIIDKIGKEFTGLGKSVVSTALGLGEPVYNLPEEAVKLATGKEIYKPLSETKLAKEEGTAQPGEKIGMAVGDIAQLAIGGIKGVEKGIEKVSGKTVQEISASLKDKKLLEKVSELPTGKAKTNAIEKGQGKTTASGDVKIQPSANDKEIAKATKGIVTSAKSETNINALNKEIETQSTDILSKLEKNPTQIDKNAIDNVINHTTKKEALSSEKETFADTKEIFDKSIADQPKTTAGLKKALMDFDQKVADRWPNIYDTNHAESSRLHSIKLLRNDVNEILQSLEPKYKEVMKNESLLIQARENIAERVAKGKYPKTISQKVVKGLKSTAGKVILGGAATIGGEKLLENIIKK